MPYVTIEGRALHYRDVGAGRAVLLLHGFPMTGACFWPQVNAPPPGVRLIVPDQRGFGQSVPGPGVTSMEAYASDALGLLDALKISNAVVGGLSMGGYVTMALLRLDPARVSGLVLIDTWCGADDDAGKLRREATAAQLETTGIDSLVEGLLPSLLTSRADEPVRRRLEAMMRSVDPLAAASASRGMALRADSREILSRFSGPALVVVGSEDPLTPPARARQMAELISGARLIEIPNAAHVANLEQPEAFNAALSEFLAYGTDSRRS